MPQVGTRDHVVIGSGWLRVGADVGSISPRETKAMRALTKWCGLIGHGHNAGSQVRSDPRASISETVMAWWMSSMARSTVTASSSQTSASPGGRLGSDP